LLRQLACVCWTQQQLLVQMDLGSLTAGELEAIILDDAAPSEQRHAAISAHLLMSEDAFLLPAVSPPLSAGPSPESASPTLSFPPANAAPALLPSPGPLTTPEPALNALPGNRRPLNGRYDASPGATLNSWVVIEVAREGRPSQVVEGGFASRQAAEAYAARVNAAG
jgi:hypothetical protein